MRALTNAVVSIYLKNRFRALNEASSHPIETQNKVLLKLLKRAKDTLYGKKYRFSEIKNYTQFKEQTPISDYNSIKHFIHDMMMGKPNVLWPGEINQFAKSSGTTSDKSKFIPVSKENLYKCHIKSSWDSVSLLYRKDPDSRMFADKSLILPGSLERFKPYQKTVVGDVSAILISNMQSIAKPYYTPSLDIALLPDWEEKIEKTAHIASKQNVTMIGGVPSWTMLLLERILEITQKDHILEVWPNLKVYMHGGVGFKPYRSTFEKFLPGKQIIYQEIYNASEGYFAVQDQLLDPGLMLLLDNGVFYEFISLDELDKISPEVVSLENVELNKSYALLISTNSGLWRYMIGDTIRFTSLAPYRIEIVGRTQQFINMFGEELMIGDTEKALAETCFKHKASILDYSVAPYFDPASQKAHHDWLIEFKKAPADINQFTFDLDAALRRTNSDYEAKRYKGLVLQNLQITIVPENCFINWLKTKGKIGAQRKIPRLSNSRKYIDEILELCEAN